MDSSMPIYRQYVEVPPPQRFLQTIDAYLDLLRETDGTWSGRRLARESGLSHNYFSAFKARLKDLPDYSPGVNTIDPIIAALNRHLPGEQRWPRLEALEAANVKPADIEAQQVHIHAERSKPVAPPTNIDVLPPLPAQIALPVLSGSIMEAKGMAAAVDTRAVFQVKSNMALVQDPLPGYTPQREGDWALIQSPDAPTPQGVQPWALVREGQHLRAVPYGTAKRQQIVAWILGTLCLDPD